MPELPEVETYRKYLEGTSLQQKIAAISCRDNRLLKQDLERFKNDLIGHSFTGTERIGKYLFVQTSGSKILVFHFGMTGNLDYYKDPEDRPKYAHIVYHFENGFNLGFLNKRKFGWNDLTDSVAKYQQKAGLSADATSLDFASFSSSLRNRKTAIKAVIMDQKVTAGIGNWLADEILYQSRIHPEKPVQELNAEELKLLFDTMKKVLEISIKEEAVYSRFPKDFFIHIRKAGSKCHHTGASIEKLKVGGRTTYYSPEWQKPDARNGKQFTLSKS